MAFETCFPSFDVPNMSRSFTATQDFCGNKIFQRTVCVVNTLISEIDDALGNDLEKVKFDLSGEESDVKC